MPQRTASITQPFQHHKWIAGANLQTIWPNYFRKRDYRRLTLQRLELPDGDFLDLCVTASARSRDHLGNVLIFHGLGGNLRSHYATSLMRCLSTRHFNPIFVHFRGASGECNRKPISYHAGKTDDIAFVINHLSRQFPNQKLFAIGVSIGGSALLNYLGKSDLKNPLTAAAAVSVPYLLEDAAKQLDSGFAKTYQRYLLNCQKTFLRKKFSQMPCPVNLENALRAQNFLAFDDAATAPLHGFRNALDYYEQCSARQYLKSNLTPTLLIHAKDDPFMSASSIPTKNELSLQTTLELHTRGGHMGFIEGNWPWQQQYYLERRIPDYFESFLTS